MKEIRIEENDAGQRLDKFLGKAFPDLKRSMMYKGLRNKKIKVNRKRASHDQMLNSGDVILLFLPEDALRQKNEGFKPSENQGKMSLSKKSSVKENEKISIIFEDQDLLIVDKPTGLLSQKDSSKDQNTMADQIISHLIDNGSYDRSKALSFVPAAVSRLDRNTAGLCAAGKNARSLRLLNEAIKDHSLKKFYLAEASGILKKDRYDLKLYLKKEGTKAHVFKDPEAGALEANLIIKVLKRKEKENSTLIEVELLTGRFHQIRATLAYLDHPLIGDHKYGYQGKENAQHLYAYRIDFSKTPFKENIMDVQVDLAMISWLSKQDYSAVFDQRHQTD